MSNHLNDFGDLNAASGGNPALKNFLGKLADAQNLANIGVNSVPPGCQFSVDGVDGTFVVIITNPQDTIPLSPKLRRKFVADDEVKPNRRNVQKLQVVHQLESSLTRLFDAVGDVKTYGPDPKLRWDIADSPNENRYWRLRSSYDNGTTYNDWAYLTDPIVCGVVTVWSQQVRGNSIMPNAQLNSTNFATIDSLDAGASATIRVYGPGGVGTTWTRKVASTTEGPFPSASLTGYAYGTDFYVYYDAATVSYKVFTLAQQSNGLADLYRWVGKVHTCNAGGAGGTGGGGGSDGGFGGCTEVGTELVFPADSEVSLIVEPCSEWYPLRLPDREPLWLAKGTLVSVFKTVEEIKRRDRVEVDEGDWAFAQDRPKLVRKKSFKQKPRVRPGQTYRAKKSGVRLHNLKPL